LTNFYAIKSTEYQIIIPHFDNNFIGFSCMAVSEESCLKYVDFLHLQDILNERAVSIALKILQNSSAITKISVTLSSVSIAIRVLV